MEVWVHCQQMSIFGVNFFFKCEHANCTSSVERQVKLISYQLWTVSYFNKVTRFIARRSSIGQLLSENVEVLSQIIFHILSRLLFLPQKVIEKYKGISSDGFDSSQFLFSLVSAFSVTAVFDISSQISRFAVCCWTSKQ